MDKVSVKELRENICSFREKMGDATLKPEQRVNMFKMLSILYIRLDQDDPEYRSGVAQYIAASHEYVQRMCLMGLACEL